MDYSLLSLIPFWAFFFGAAWEDYDHRKVRDIYLIGLYASFLLQFPSQGQLLAGASAVVLFWMERLVFPKSEIGWADIMAILPILGYAVGALPLQWVVSGFGVAFAHEVSLSVRHKERRTPFITACFVALLVAGLLSYLF